MAGRDQFTNHQDPSLGYVTFCVQAVISPLLANIYLHSFDKMFQIAKIPGTLVRYADDFVILLWRNGKEILEKVRQMLGRLGLTLHPEKTRVVAAKEGFDFLGVHLRLCPEPLAQISP